MTIYCAGAVTRLSFNASLAPLFAAVDNSREGACWPSFSRLIPLSDMDILFTYTNYYDNINQGGNAMPKSVRSMCLVCGEPTTHQLRMINGKAVYVCLMCEAGKSRSIEELERIKKNRKGWRVS